MTEPKTPERLIAYRRARIARLDEKIGALMSQRVTEEEALADLLPKFKTGNPVVADGVQPFTGSQEVVVEKRTPDGKLDFSEPQPPTESMTFDALYSLYFRDSTGPGTWAALREWLEAKHWVVRVKTW